MATVRITHAELSRLVGIVAPSVGREELLPVFTWVHFRSRNGRIEVQGTDRYTLAFARGEAKMPQGCEFNLALKDLRHALAATKPQRRAGVDLILKVTPDLVTITAAQETLASGADLRLTYENPKGTWPKLDHMLTGWENREAATRGVGLNPKYLRRIPQFKNEPIVFVSSGPKPDGRSNPAGAFGPDWALIIMPVRLDGHQDWPAHWLSPAPAESESVA